MFLFIAQLCHAQDIIVLQSGGNVKAKIIEVGTTSVKYKLFDHIDGPDYVLEKNKINTIVYNGGRTESFTPPKSHSGIYDGPKYSVNRKHTELGRIEDSLAIVYRNGHFNSYYKWPLHVAAGWEVGSFGVASFGINLHGEYCINDYLTVDFISITWQRPFHGTYHLNGIDVDPGFLHLLPAGFHLNTPNYGSFRGFTYIDFGITLAYLRGSYTYGNKTYKETKFYPGFGLNYGVGIYVTKNVTLSYSLAYNTNTRDIMHAAKMGFIF